MLSPCAIPDSMLCNGHELIHLRFCQKLEITISQGRAFSFAGKHGPHYQVKTTGTHPAGAHTEIHGRKLCQWCQCFMDVCKFDYYSGGTWHRSYTFGTLKDSKGH